MTSDSFLPGQMLSPDLLQVLVPVSEQAPVVALVVVRVVLWVVAEAVAVLVELVLQVVPVPVLAVLAVVLLPMDCLSERDSDSHPASAVQPV